MNAQKSPPGAPKKKRKSPLPWLLALALLGSLYAFWVLPMQLGKRPVQVDFPETPTP